MTDPKCPSCGTALEATDTDTDPWAQICTNPACPNDK